MSVYQWSERLKWVFFQCQQMCFNIRYDWIFSLRKWRHEKGYIGAVGEIVIKMFEKGFILLKYNPVL